MLQKGLHVFLLRVLPLQWRMQTFELKGGPPGYPDPEIRGGGGGEGLQKIFSLV